MKRLLTSRRFVPALSLLITLGCGEPGDRAFGGCPTDEMCSDWTPAGLYFAGARLADFDAPFGVPPTAIGGHQTVHVLETADFEGPEYVSTFDAVSTDPAVFQVSADHSGPIDVEGVGAGTAYLRLLEPGTSRLLDRVDLRVEPVARIELAPRGVLVSTDWALLASSTADVAVHLRDASDDLVVDEGTTVSGADVMRTLAWDEVEILAPAAGSTTVHVEAGDTAADVDVPVVDHLDSIDSSATETELEVGEVSTYCFEPRTDGVFVAGVEMSFSVSGDASVVSDPAIPSWCVQVTGSAEGSATITVTAMDITGTLDLSVVPAPDTGSMSAPLVEAGGAAPGERAGSPGRR